MTRTLPEDIQTHFPQLSLGEITTIIEMAAAHMFVTYGQDTPVRRIVEYQQIERLRDHGYVIMPLGVGTLPVEGYIKGDDYRSQVQIAITIPRHVRGAEMPADTFLLDKPDYRNHLSMNLAHSAIVDMHTQTRENASRAVEDAWRQYR